MQQSSETLDLAQALALFRRRAPLILLCAVVVAGAAFAFSKHQTKKYTATASLTFSSNQLSQQVAGLPAASSGSLVAQQSSNLELVRLGDMAAKTASKLGHGLTEEEVSGSLSIAAQGESSFVNVSVTTASPTLSAQIANIYVKQFVAEQQAANRKYFKSALALVNKQLAALSSKQRLGQDGVALQDRAQSLGLLADLQSDSVRVAEEALPPTHPSSPKTSRNTALGLLLGLFLGLGLAFLLERMDRRIRRPEDLETIFRLPLLGAIPKSAALRRSAKQNGATPQVLPSAEAEAFHLIRAHLRFFNINRDLRTIFIASAADGDGKTTIARHLASAATRMDSRVLLLELDLRHPTLAKQLGIPPGPGLADVLAGTIPMDEAIHSICLETPSHGRSNERTLDVLPAGAVLPPNPGELIEGRAAATLLEQARSAYDLVVIDAPPLTAVSDAFPLLSKVDGVVIVSWVGRSRRDLAEQLHQILDNSGALLLGIIANGAKTRGPDSGAYTSNNALQPASISANGNSSSQKFAPTAKA